MVNVPVAYDVTRLFLGPLSSTPRGIDRVDFAIAARLFRQSAQPCVGIMPTPWGTRTFSRNSVRRGLRRLERLWAERHSIGDQQIWERLVTDMNGQPSPGREHVAPPGLGLSQKVRRMTSLVSAAGTFAGRSACASVPDGAVYLNVGHLSLALPFGLRWLDRRPDVTPVFMLHDVIPLDTPQYVSASSARHHATMVRSTARHAAGLIVTTRDARNTVCEALARFGRPSIATLAQPLPVPRAFNKPESADPALAGISYFVICGAIEPRKNHALLFDIWHRLVLERGKDAPHLVVVGSRGWRSEEILADWSERPELQRKIHVVSGLGTSSLKRLLAGAAGLLMPSHAEGFGLPLIEAARLGVPAIASNIPAHREVAAQNACLLDPCDGAAWYETIVSWIEGARPRVAPRPVRSVVDEREAYFKAIDGFIETCAVECRARLTTPATASGRWMSARGQTEPVLR